MSVIAVVMNIVRQIMGISLACFVGVLVPVAVTTGASVYQHYHGTPDSSWLQSLITQVKLIAILGGLVGLFVGSIGVWLLHLMRRKTLWDYVMAGAVLGASSGLSGVSAISTLIIGMSEPGDPSVSWLSVIYDLSGGLVLPAASMALGFACYWFVCVRSRIIYHKLV